MVFQSSSASPSGIGALLIRIAVDLREGPPQLQILGIPEAALRESRERVRAAVQNSGFTLPRGSIVVDVTPANQLLRDHCPPLDLPIALTLLAAGGHLPQDALRNTLICGELGLDGTLRPIRGGLAIAELAQRLGALQLLLPHASAGEAAALAGGSPVIPLCGLAEAIHHLRGDRRVAAIDPPGLPLDAPLASMPDLSEIRGHEMPRRALEVAAAGGHNLLLVGPPGSGKTMLARRLPCILPPLTPPEALEVTKIHSLVADQPLRGLMRRRPFRAPHTSTSAAGMLGGGSNPRPGEASLSHCGVLFLDELPEFPRHTLEALRQPLTQGFVTLIRPHSRIQFPTRFSLVAATNPCPCGHLGDPRHDCRCSPQFVERYRARISGSLLDRFDLHVEVPAVSLKDLNTPPGECSAVVARRVAAARSIQLERFGSAPAARLNAQMDAAALRQHCQLDPAGNALLEAAFKKLGLSALAADQILAVARTVADLAGSAPIRTFHLAEALQYRTFDGWSTR